MPKLGNRDSEKERLWQRLLFEFSKSGMTQAAFCKANNVSTHQFGYWRAEFQKREKKIAGTGKAPELETPVFLPVNVADQAPPLPSQNKVMEIRCKDGIVVQIPDNVSADTFVLIGKLIKKLKC